jgi:PEP-CTERM motif
MKTLRIQVLVRIGLFITLFAAEGQADILTFESDSPAANASTRANWLTASGIVSPENLVNFESGFTNNENISGVTGLFPGGLVISDTSSAHAAIIKSGAGVIGGSNPVGMFSLTQNEQPYLQLDFSARPIDYLGFLDIDQAGTTGIITFVGGATANFSFGTTPSDGDSAQFYGIFDNNLPQITKIQFDASGDGIWGIDNIEFGANAAVVPEPSSLVLFGIGGAIALAVAQVRRKRSV